MQVVGECAWDRLPRLSYLWVDAGYRGRGKDWAEEALGVEVEIVNCSPKPPPEKVLRIWAREWFKEGRKMDLQHVASVVTQWDHGRMSGYSEDLRERIVSAVKGGMSKAQAASTFFVSLSSVKRYLNKVKRGESLAPKKRPGSAPKLDEKARRLLAIDLEERPYLTLQERCYYIEAMTGLSVSRSTMCRAIARIGSTRKKGDESPQSVTSSGGRSGG